MRHSTTVHASTWGAIALAFSLLSVGCGSSDDDPVDAGFVDAAAIERDAGQIVLDAAGSRDTGMIDAAPSNDAATDDAASPDAGAADANAADAGAVDASAIDGGPSFNCGLFSTDPGWTVAAGFRAVVVAEASDGLNQPVALKFAGGPFGQLLYVVNQGNSTITTLDVRTGSTAVFTMGTAWAIAPRLLTTITWDELHVFDGNIYVGDQGGDGDTDSVIFRVTSTGTTTVFAQAPGPGLDDIYALAFSPGGAYPAGLYVSGDTDGAGVDWGRFDGAGVGTTFSEVTGVEGIATDTGSLFGGLIYAARPLGGGYSGDGTITAIAVDGTAQTPLASNLGGVHANVFSPGGTYGRDMYAASWSSGELIRITATGTVSVVASGLSLTNYDGNILDFSSDGNVLFVADRSANRVVCIEPL